MLSLIFRSINIMLLSLFLIFSVCDSAIARENKRAISKGPSKSPSTENKGLDSQKLPSAQEEMGMGDISHSMIRGNEEKTIQRKKISSIAFRGNRNVPFKVLELALTLKKGMMIPVNQEDFEKIIEGTIGEIYKLGTFSRVSLAGAEETRDGIALYFDLLENPVISEIAVFGDKIIPDEEILKVMNIGVNEVLNANTFREDVKNINKLYEDNDMMMDQRSTISVDDSWSRLVVDAYALKIGEISVQGNKKTTDKVIIRECVFKTGELYSIKKLRRSFRNLQNLGFFKSVDFFTRPMAQKGLAEIVVEVEEQDTGSIRFGGAYGSENGLSGLFEVAENNLMGTGRTLKLKTEFGADKTYELSFVEPWIGRWPNSLGFSAYNTKLSRRYYDNTGAVLDTYTESKKGGSVTFSRKFNLFLKSSISFSDENTAISENLYGIEGGRSQRIATKIARDTRSNIFSPRFGSNNELLFNTTGGFLLGKNHFYSTELEHSQFMPLSEKLVLAWRMSMGFINLRNGEVPAYDLFAVGGGNSIRGFRERELSGTRLILGNLELRHSFSDAFGATAFLDTGKAGENADFGDIKTGAGIGVNFKTPLGVIRLDYARSISEKRGAKTYFNFGQMF